MPATEARTRNYIVVDAQAKKVFSTIPRNVAAERDFNRIDVDGAPPDALENGIAGFEGKVDQALELICEQKQFDDPGDRAYVFNLIAMLAIRNPRTRESVRQFHENI